MFISIVLRLSYFDFCISMVILLGIIRILIVLYVFVYLYLVIIICNICEMFRIVIFGVLFIVE